MLPFREKRASKRLPLTDSIEGQFGPARARVLEIGTIGALVDHPIPFPVGSTATLEFEHKGQTVKIDSEVIRTTMAGFPRDGETANYQSGLRFIQMEPAAAQAVESLIAGRAKEMLMSQAANAMGLQLPQSEKHGFAAAERSRRSRQPGFICFSFERGAWERTGTINPAQPNEGFTVAASEDPDEIENLCHAYESSDEEGRKMIRLLAELSLRDETG